ncbi:glutamate-rich protein 1 [Callorhinchus milii]|uniref:Glutamate-rich protein 1 n=1 Tax=Callorhinchus milii TaxID=7868 RepID=A0A4W3K207_CALMI|nr:glutamate-rich protein 1 [Callorhinchus milii]|eukprot:gi/632953074/ref/XP_007892208.1/ PREDICTED: glutamate-rich protein 1 [Callorhinchus milii]
MSRRSDVFKQHVLNQLYGLPHIEEKNLEAPTKQSSANQEQRSKISDSSIDVKQTIPVHRKIYTVSLPPSQYEMSSTRQNEQPKSHDSSDEVQDESDCPRRFQRKRRHKRKLCSSFSFSNDAQTVLEQQPKLFETDILQTTHIDSAKHTTETLSKNKKRKLKKKRHKEKLRAAGLLSKATALEFTYQPEEGRSEEDDAEGEKKASEIIDFLQATQEIYFTDGKNRAEDVCPALEDVHRILQSLESGTVPSSDVLFLHRLKNLVVLQDINRLTIVLKEFKENAMMSPGEATAVCSLFHYWVTDILSMNKNNRNNNPCI